MRVVSELLTFSHAERYLEKSCIKADIVIPIFFFICSVVGQWKIDITITKINAYIQDLCCDFT